ncbi:MAG: DNA polymerase III subunit beta [Candidatus Colwellbacteria bacterium CG10_big_fil_rev_8_21_14_0_10_42_22]|uniref:Beta sliding clamp n=1 Tax=Candidatus Colwellbacteria bacterium CG10_big_fil_rev_8_21_14_0_10_42_22 TaxID=1974540 RepID=A0A2H0VFT2_9BACT|nr:MAG: DNA polymerase III subunit beta [Candidatus Colwellbacteria bacterium CG10_big_fil_rev_8_21_14_0_10_42_22]
MKIIILKESLKNGLDAVGRAVGSNTNLPVLSSVLIKASGSQIKMSATNLELALTKTVFGKIIEEGSLVVPYAILAGMVNNISTERVNLEAKAGNLIVKTDNYEASIQGTDEKEFPIIPTIKSKKEKLEIESTTLKEALSKTSLAAEISDLRPEISGVLFSIEPSLLKIVATDSFRLAEARISGEQIKSTFEKGSDTTIPLKAAQELPRVAPEKGFITLYTDETQALFEAEGVELITRVIEGKFPDYQAIVPKEIETEVLVERDDLINGLKLTGSFSGRSNEVVLKTGSKKMLELSASDSGVGKNKYIIPAKINGPDTETVFNWQYLLDGIRNERSKNVSLGINGEERPTLVKSPESGSYYYILMPIRA